MRLEHVYLEIDGVLYNDLLLGFAESLSVPDHCVFVNKELKRNLETLTPFMSQIPSIPKDTTIYLTPNCPYSIEDVRARYNLKKKCDTAEYNVFSPPTKIKWSWKTSYQAMCVFPSDGFAFASKDAFSSPKDAIKKAMDFFQCPIDTSDMIIIGDGYLSYLSEKAFAPYEKLLKRELQKPCVSYKSLDLSSDLAPTMDVLRLIYQTGRIPYYEKDAEKNFLIQLNVLNQYDWRKYPMTVCVLLWQLLKDGIAREIRDCKSRHSKVIKELYNTKYPDKPSREDFELCQAFVSELLGVGDCKYADISDVFNKLSNINLNIGTFDKLFSNIVRIKPIQYNAG